MVETIREVKEKKRNDYNVNTGKSYVTVKHQYKDKIIEIFKKSYIKITTDGHWNFGSVIGSKQFSENNISSLVASQWLQKHIHKQHTPL